MTLTNQLTKIMNSLKKFNLSRLHFVSGLFGALIGVLATFLFLPKEHFATIDLTGLVKKFTRESAKQNIDELQLKQRMKQFSYSLEKALFLVSQKHHVVLLPRQAVIAGATDYTEEVERYLKQHSQDND